MDAAALGQAVTELLIRSEKREQHMADEREWRDKAATKINRYKEALGQQQNFTADLQAVVAEQQASLRDLESAVLAQQRARQADIEALADLRGQVEELCGAFRRSQVENAYVLACTNRILPELTFARELREIVKAQGERLGRLEPHVQPSLLESSESPRVVEPETAPSASQGLSAAVPSRVSVSPGQEAPEMDVADHKSVDQTRENAAAQRRRVGIAAAALADMPPSPAVEAQVTTAINALECPVAETQGLPLLAPTPRKTTREQQTSVTRRTYSFSVHTTIRNGSHPDESESEPEDTMITASEDLDIVAIPATL